MKILLYILLLFTLVNNVYALPEIMKKNKGVYSLFQEVQQCMELNDKNCLPLLQQLLQKGHTDKVEFLDYLYYKTARYLYSQGQVDSALFYAHHGISYQAKYSDNYYADLLNVIGSAFYAKGDLDSAIYYLIESSSASEQAGDSTKWAYSLVNIGIMLGTVGNNQQAIEYLLKAYHLQNTLNDSSFIATTAGNLAIIYYHLNNREKSFEWAYKAIELNETLNEQTGKMLGNYTLAFLYNESNLDSAFFYSKQAVELSKTMSDLSRLGGALHVYAFTLFKKEQKELAIQAINEAMDIQQKWSNLEGLVKTYALAAEIYSGVGKYKEATDFYAQYKLLKDSLMDQSTSQVVSEINTKYETEKKERMLAEKDVEIKTQQMRFWLSLLGGSLLVLLLGGFFLYNKNVHRAKLKQLEIDKENAKLNSFIQGEERERTRISLELHDHVAAKIGAAKLSMEALPHLTEQKQNEQFQKVRKILEQTHADIRHIAHNLFPAVLEQEGLVKAVEQYVSEINGLKSTKIAVYDQQSHANNLSKQIQLMLFRIIQELITNILKHAQAEEAKIIFSEETDGLQIEVCDNGIGYDGSINTKSQGLYSISQRLKSIGGSFRFVRKEDKGMSAIAEVKY